MGVGPCGDLLGTVLFSLKSHRHPGTGARGPQGWHLPQYLGMETDIQHHCHPRSNLLLQGRGPRLVTLVTLGIFPITLGLQEAVSWAAPWCSVSLNLPPARGCCHPVPAHRRWLWAHRGGHTGPGTPPCGGAGCGPHPATESWSWQTRHQFLIMLQMPP